MSKEEIEVTAGDQRQKSGRYLTFQLGDESYGITVLKVREIIQMQPITQIPRTPDYMKGVINLRGKVIPVADLRIKFAFEKAEVSERTCIIVVSLTMTDGRETLTGLIVDAVEEVLQIEAEQIEDAPSFSDTAISTDYIFGMAKVRDNVKMLIDIDKVVLAENLEDMAQMAGGEPPEMVVED
jgi:purine-binding chemotaxis protein CheW